MWTIQPGHTVIPIVITRGQPSAGPTPAVWAIDTIGPSALVPESAVREGVVGIDCRLWKEMGGEESRAVVPPTGAVGPHFPGLGRVDALERGHGDERLHANGGDVTAQPARVVGNVMLQSSIQTPST